MRVGPDSARDLARSIITESDVDMDEELVTLKQGECYFAQVDKPAIKMRVRNTADPEIASGAADAVLNQALRNYGRPRSSLQRERANFARFLAGLETGRGDPTVRQKQSMATHAHAGQEEGIIDDDARSYHPKRTRNKA